MNIFKERRLMLEMTQNDLAKLVGISQSMVSLVENGYKALNEKEMSRLCEILDIEKGPIFPKD